MKEENQEGSGKFTAERYLEVPFLPLPDIAVVTQCEVVVSAWEFWQRIKAEYPGTAKAATAEGYLRRTFATLQADIVACIFPRPEGRGEASEPQPDPSNIGPQGQQGGDNAR